MIEFCQDFDEIVSNYRNNFNLKFESLLNKTDFLATNLQLNKKELHFIISCIDLTTLSGDDTREKVQKLVEIALHPLKTETKLTCAAVCVYPARIQDVKDSLNVFEKKINVASVAGGFPSGQYHLQSRLLEIKLALADGAHEIDVVIDRSLVLNENWKTLYTELKTMKEICGSVALLKVILSVGDLKCYKKIYLASWVAMLAGVDFFKN